LIEQVDQQLRDWVIQVLGPTTVTLDSPAPSPTGQGVSLYLYALNQAFPSSGSGALPLQIELRYLVSAWAEQPEEAHRLLDRLVFAAMTNPAFEIDLAPLPPETWLSYGVKPLPCFVLKAPVRIDRKEPLTPIVRKPLEVHATPVTQLEGTVLGPGDLPLANARVEIPFLDRSTRTDTHGRFQFQAVPADPGVRKLRVVLKGWSLDVELEQPSLARGPITVHFDPFNGKRD
jgi:hypothetical protein